MDPRDPSTNSPATEPDPGAGPTPKPAAEQPSLFKRLGPAGLLGVAWVAMPPIAGMTLLIYMPTIADWLRGHQQSGYIFYIAVFILSAGFGVLPTYSQSLLAGYAFGVAAGIPAAWSGFVGASMIGYFIARTVSKDRVEREIASNPKAQAIKDALIGGGFWKTAGIVTLLRMPPNSPFALTNLVLSASGVGRRAFVLGTAVGMLPRTAAAVVIGSKVQDWAQQERPWWWMAAGIALTLVVLGVIGLLANRALDKVRASQTPATA